MASGSQSLSQLFLLLRSETRARFFGWHNSHFSYIWERSMNGLHDEIPHRKETKRGFCLLTWSSLKLSFNPRHLSNPNAHCESETLLCKYPNMRLFVGLPWSLHATGYSYFSSGGDEPVGVSQSRGGSDMAYGGLHDRSLIDNVGDWRSISARSLRSDWTSVKTWHRLRACQQPVAVDDRVRSL
jgi:hypothetical protein